jgi:hypothetical protein
MCYRNHDRQCVFCLLLLAPLLGWKFMLVPDKCSFPALVVSEFDALPHRSAEARTAFNIIATVTDKNN